MRTCPHCFMDMDESDDLPAGVVSGLVAIVCDRLVVEPAKVLSSSKDRRVVDARNACIGLLRDMFGLSYAALGRIFERDHTTVMHGYGKADKALVRALMDDLQQMAPEGATDAHGAAVGLLKVVE